MPVDYKGSTTFRRPATGRLRVFGDTNVAKNNRRILRRCLRVTDEEEVVGELPAERWRREKIAAEHVPAGQIPILP